MAVTVDYRDASDVGSCSFCNDHIRVDPPHIVPHKVVVISSDLNGSQEVRACRSCARELVLAVREQLHT